MIVINLILDRYLPKLMRIIIIFTQITFTSIIFGSVAARQFFGRDLYGNEDFVLIAAFWLYMIGGAYGSYENSHIKADIISEVLKKGKLKKILETSAVIVGTAVSLIIAVWGWHLIVWSYAKGARSISWKIPMFIPQSAIFIGFAIMFIYGLREIIRCFREFSGTRENSVEKTICEPERN